MCCFCHLLLFMLFIIIVDTLPSLPACSDNEKNVPISDEGIIVITDTDDDNPTKWYI